jgi:hypothetical protein
MPDQVIGTSDPGNHIRTVSRFGDIELYNFNAAPSFFSFNCLLHFIQCYVSQTNVA